MHKDDANRLRHMRDAAQEAISFARGRTRSDLDTDRMLVLALIKDVEIIGEAANQISEDTRRNARQFPGRILSVCVIAWSTPTSTSTSKSFGGQCNKTSRRYLQCWRRYWSKNKQNRTSPTIGSPPDQIKEDLAKSVESTACRARRAEKFFPTRDAI